MIIATLSGKGGTGKTTLSTNLASMIQGEYIDCDVEEPNGYIFLKPKIVHKESVTASFPNIKEEICNCCGECVQHCQFNALVNVKNKVLVFEKLCHGCGVCNLVCPMGAVEESPREIGTIEIGISDEITYRGGILNIGEPMAAPIIKKLKKTIPRDKTIIIDCPPGTTCSTVQALYGADYAVLVTEPTLFGLHDLKKAIELANSMKIPFGVVINKSNQYTYLIKDYCVEKGIRILGEIPYSKEVAYQYSRGELLREDKILSKIWDGIKKHFQEVAI